MWDVLQESDRKRHKCVDERRKLVWEQKVPSNVYYV